MGEKIRKQIGNVFQENIRYFLEESKKYHIITERDYKEKNELVRLTKYIKSKKIIVEWKKTQKNQIHLLYQDISSTVLEKFSWRYISHESFVTEIKNEVREELVYISTYDFYESQDVDYTMPIFSLYVKNTMTNIDSTTSFCAIPMLVTQCTEIEMGTRYCVPTTLTIDCFPRGFQDEASRYIEEMKSKMLLQIVPNSQAQINVNLLLKPSLFKDGREREIEFNTTHASLLVELAKQLEEVLDFFVEGLTENTFEIEKILERKLNRSNTKIKNLASKKDTVTVVDCLRNEQSLNVPLEPSIMLRQVYQNHDSTVELVVQRFLSREEKNGYISLGDFYIRMGEKRAKLSDFSNLHRLSENQKQTLGKKLNAQTKSNTTAGIEDISIKISDLLADKLYFKTTLESCQKIPKFKEISVKMPYYPVERIGKKELKLISSEVVKYEHTFMLNNILGVKYQGKCYIVVLPMVPKLTKICQEGNTILLPYIVFDCVQTQYHIFEIDANSIDEIYEKRVSIQAACKMPQSTLVEQKIKEAVFAEMKASNTNFQIKQPSCYQLKLDKEEGDEGERIKLLTLPKDFRSLYTNPEQLVKTDLLTTENPLFYLVKEIVTAAIK